MNLFGQYIDELKQTLDQLPLDTIDAMVQLLHSARLQRRQVFVIGNGGSASTASHVACDIGKNTVQTNVPRFRIMSLVDNMATFSAYANDCGYENVFAEQLANLLQEQDILISISASGNSPNILNAVELAQSRKAITVGWSGYEGGKLANIVDFPIVVRNHCIEQIEDIHLFIGHMVTTALRQLAQEEGTMRLSNANGLAEMVY